MSGSRSERLDNIWTKSDSALRDLLVFLVKKHRVDEVHDSKVKAQNWEKLIGEFNDMTGGLIGMPKAQLIRKWHNWKQYTKQRSKAHPFIIVGNILIIFIFCCIFQVFWKFGLRGRPRRSAEVRVIWEMRKTKKTRQNMRLPCLKF